MAIMWEVLCEYLKIYRKNCNCKQCVQNVVFFNELCRGTCICESLTQSAHTTRSVKKLFLIRSKCSESFKLNHHRGTLKDRKSHREIVTRNNCHYKGELLCKSPFFFLLETAMLYCRYIVLHNEQPVVINGLFNQYLKYDPVFSVRYELNIMQICVLHHGQPIVLSRVFDQ